MYLNYKFYLNLPILSWDIAGLGLALKKGIDFEASRKLFIKSERTNISLHIFHQNS